MRAKCSEASKKELRCTGLRTGPLRATLSSRPTRPLSCAGRCSGIGRHGWLSTRQRGGPLLSQRCYWYYYYYYYYY